MLTFEVFGSNDKASLVLPLATKDFFWTFLGGFPELSTWEKDARSKWILKKVRRVSQLLYGLFWGWIGRIQLVAETQSMFFIARRVVAPSSPSAMPCCTAA